MYVQQVQPCSWSILVTLWSLVCTCTQIVAAQNDWQFVKLGGIIDLQWRLENDQFHFQIDSLKVDSIGLAYSYNDVPVDGFIVNWDGIKYTYKDLHLDYADIVRERFSLVPDTSNEVVITSAEKRIDSVHVEGYRPIQACNDTQYDISLTGDILKIFYMYGDIWKDGFVKLDLRNAKMFGSRYITLKTKVDYTLNGLRKYPSTTFEIGDVRPMRNGSANCKVVEFSEDFGHGGIIGYKPILQGFNEKNGLIQSISIMECFDTENLQEYVGPAVKCNVPGNEYKPMMYCTKPIFVWTPGSAGEQLPDGQGIKINPSSSMASKPISIRWIRTSSKSH